MIVVRRTPCIGSGPKHDWCRTYPLACCRMRMCCFRFAMPLRQETNHTALRPPLLASYLMQTRSKSVLGFLHDIVLLTARRLDTAAKTKINDHNAIVTPFATETWEQEFVLSDR